MKLLYNSTCLRYLIEFKNITELYTNIFKFHLCNCVIFFQKLFFFDINQHFFQTFYYSKCCFMSIKMNKSYKFKKLYRQLLLLFIISCRTNLKLLSITKHSIETFSSKSLSLYPNVMCIFFVVHLLMTVK